MVVHGSPSPLDDTRPRAPTTLASSCTVRRGGGTIVSGTSPEAQQPPCVASLDVTQAVSSSRHDTSLRRQGTFVDCTELRTALTAVTHWHAVVDEGLEPSRPQFVIDWYMGCAVELAPHLRWRAQHGPPTWLALERGLGPRPLPPSRARHVLRIPCHLTLRGSSQRGGARTFAPRARHTDASKGRGGGRTSRTSRPAEWSGRASREAPRPAER